uniref:Uncharacterized protein n=1 Tax=Anguilla anguilla TaxID=7936 RepID=A0A0E9XQY0_ANGAN
MMPFAKKFVQTKWCLGSTMEVSRPMNLGF